MVRSPLSPQRLAGDFDLQHQLGKHFLQAGVLAFRLLQALGIWHAHATELAAPEVVAVL